MKKLLFLTLVATSALAVAQTPAPPPGTNPRGGKNADIAELERGTRVSEADEARLRSELDAARKRLDEAAHEVAELSGRLGMGAGRDVFFIDGNAPRRAVLGVQIDARSGPEGARILNVSPGGAAEDAGLLAGDLVVNLDGKKIAGLPDASRAVIDHMRSVTPDQKVKVKVQRGGRNRDFVVVARPAPMIAGNRVFNSTMAMPMAEIRTFPGFWRGEFGGMELAGISPRLGAYFGATEGVLVVKAPEDAAFKLEDGDVIQSIDGRKPEDGVHAMRILRSYRGGEKLMLSVLRQRKTLNLAVTLPERPEFQENFLMPVPPAPPVPPPLPPPGAGSAAGGGTL